MTAASLLVALLFAAIFLFGGRVAFRSGHKGYRRFLSFAAGCAVAYVFVDVMPALGRMRDLVVQAPGDFQRFFPEYSVYLWALAGFLIFYSLEALVVVTPRGTEPHAGEHTAQPPKLAWLHIGGFALYAWLLSYIMVWKLHEPLALCLYAVAMGMHLFPIACHLSNHYPDIYNRRGALVLALASVVGWFIGVTVDIPKPILVNLIAVVAGGVIVNSAIAELPKGDEKRQGAFLSGALVYTTLLLVLSHFEHGGH